jgi:hypothetical protein
VSGALAINQNKKWWCCMIALMSVFVTGSEIIVFFVGKFYIAVWFFMCLYVFINLVLKTKENWILELIFRVLVIMTGVLLFFYEHDGLWLEILLLGMVLSTFIHHKIAAGFFILGYGFIMYKNVKVISICLALIAGFVSGTEQKYYISRESAK